MKLKLTILMVALFAALMTACGPANGDSLMDPVADNEDGTMEDSHDVADDDDHADDDPVTTPNEGETMFTTDSGLQVEMIEVGDGPQAKAGDTVAVHYAGTLTDGTPFDDSYSRGEPITFPLGQGRVIPGWDEGIALLNVGSKARFTIPSELAYGERGSGAIPPNATLVFEVELVEIVHSAIVPEDLLSADEVEMGENATITDSGLRIEILEQGDGVQAQDGDIVSVHYAGALTNGSEFDSSYERDEPIAFPLGQNAVIPGWDEGVSMLTVGSKARLVIPPELAYGAQGAGGGVIPPNAALVFEVELLDILPPPPEAPQEVAAEDYTTTDSGLQYYDIVVGEGASPAAGQLVIVQYTGWLAEDGSMFDSSLSRGTPFQFPLGQGAVIPGWDEGVASMQVGGQRQLRIPAELGYGEGGYPPVIPASATLIFEVELVAVQ